MVKPLVSVTCITYNHEHYIRKAIDGFLMQITNFPFEIIIHDDASTDRTAVIVQDYANQHPGLIRAILQEKNQYSKGVKPYSNIVIPKALGRYIAICEGDDYWVDPLKLQKQIDFLEANPDYGLVCSDIKIIDKNNNKVSDYPFYAKQKLQYKSGDVFFDLLQGNFINTLTVCVRADLLQPLMKEANDRNLNFIYDYWIWLRISQKSKVKFMDEKFAAYRIHDQGISHQPGFLQKLTPLVYHNVLSEFLSEHSVDKLNTQQRDILYNVFYSVFRNKVVSGKIKKWAFRNMLKFKPSFIDLMKKIIRVGLFLNKLL